MADVMKKIIQESPFNTYNNHDQDDALGVFRRLTLRTTTCKTAMVLVTLKTSQLTEEKKKEVVDFVKDRIVSQIQEIKELSGGYEIKSLQFAHFSGVSNFVSDDSPLEVAHGEDHIIEEMLGLKFRISPFSFFQVNTKSAENLYRLVADLAGCSSNTILFDVCCGTGTIGITLAKLVKKVYGFELVEKAIADCEHNAKLNGCENMQFFLGKCEDTLPKVMSTLTPEEHKDVIVVLDPPRAGMHKKVLLSIRATAGVDKIVYVSCNHKSQVNDIVKLCRPTSKTFQGRPFRPITSTVVDLFPNTPHTEIVTLLTRVEDEFMPEKYTMDETLKSEAVHKEDVGKVKMAAEKEVSVKTEEVAEKVKMAAENEVSVKSEEIGEKVKMAAENEVSVKSEEAGDSVIPVKMDVDD